MLIKKYINSKKQKIDYNLKIINNLNNLLNENNDDKIIILENKIKNHLKNYNILNDEIINPYGDLDFDFYFFMRLRNSYLKFFKNENIDNSKINIFFYEYLKLKNKNNNKIDYNNELNKIFNYLLNKNINEQIELSNSIELELTKFIVNNYNYIYLFNNLSDNFKKLIIDNTKIFNYIYENKINNKIYECNILKKIIINTFICDNEYELYDMLKIETKLLQNFHKLYNNYYKSDINNYLLNLNNY